MSQLDTRGLCLKPGGQQADGGIGGRGVRDITVFNGLLKIH